MYQAWLADNGNKSMLVVNSVPKYLLDSTIFSRLLRLRDTNIGDGKTDTATTDSPVTTATAAPEATASPTDGDGGDQGDGVKVVEMSHNAAVYPPSANETEPMQRQQERRLPQRPQQANGGLAILSLFKQTLVDAFVAKLSPITGSAAPIKLRRQQHRQQRLRCHSSSQ